MELTTEESRRYDSDVVFAGHYEPDGRLELLCDLVRAGVRVRLFGPDWNKPIQSHPELRCLMPVKSLRGDDYTKALCAAKIALCFLSKLNRDTYTRRCFEIPACGVLLLSEHSEDIESLFTEGTEADFFRDRTELLAKVRFYLSHPDVRRQVAQAGRVRVEADNHDVVSRMRQVVRWAQAM